MTLITPVQAVRNTAVVFGGQIAARLLDLAATLLIARSFGEAGFGRFSFAVAYIGYFAITTDLGLNVIFVREVSKSSERPDDLLTALLAVKSLLILLSMALAAGLILIPAYPPDTMQLVWIMATALLISPKLPSLRTVYELVFQARLQMAVPVYAKLLDAGLFIACIYGVVLSDGPMTIVGLAYVLANLPGFFIILWASRRLATPTARISRPLVKRLMTQALPVALIGVFTTLYSRIDVLLLSLWRGDIEVGYYSAAYRLTEALRLIPGAVVASVYPLAASAYERASETLSPVLEYGLKPLLLVITPICFGTTLIAGQIVGLLYTDRFLPAGTALSIIVWTEFWAFINALWSFTLIACERQRSVTGVAFLMLTANLAMNAFMIPRWGYLGASVATVATEGLGTLCYNTMIRRITGVSCWRMIWPFLPGGLLVFAWTSIAGTLPIPVIIAGAAGVYAVGLWVSKAITRDEWARIKAALVK